MMAFCPLIAGEVTIEERPWVIEAGFDATVIPDGAVMQIAVDAKAWEDFEIADLTKHGTKVVKNGLLVKFETDKLDRRIEEIRRTVASDRLGLERAEQELKVLQETAAPRLEAVRRAAAIAKEENAYFTQTRRKAEEEAATQKLERSKQQLSNQQEELRQLTRMYQAGDLTKQPEETEEIILTRQKDDVAAAEFALRMEKLNHKRTLEVTLPREAVTLAEEERNTAVALRSAETEIPRAIELKKLEVDSLKTAGARNKQTLADLEHDRGLCEFKAPADGWFYHGSIENGRWTTGEILKNLVRSGHPPVSRPFATFIPGNAGMVLNAFPNEATARQMKAGDAGIATFAGREDLEVPVKIAEISTIPQPDGTYFAKLSATWPKDAPIAVGGTAQIRIITYQKPAAIVIPTKALTHDARGWNVELMLADGKTERRRVERGRTSNEGTEILSGLEIGQVIISP